MLCKGNYQEMQSLLNDKIRMAKLAYKEKVENLFMTNNSRDAWKGLKILTDIDRKRKEPSMITQAQQID